MTKKLNIFLPLHSVISGAVYDIDIAWVRRLIDFLGSNIDYLSLQCLPKLLEHMIDFST